MSKDETTTTISFICMNINPYSKSIADKETYGLSKTGPYNLELICEPPCLFSWRGPRK